MNKKKLLFILLIIAAAVLGAFTGYKKGMSEKVSELLVIEKGESSPVSMRNFLNFNGGRYAFLNNGDVYNLEGLLEKELGTLDKDILKNPENGKQDFSSTFAAGGKIYKIKNYSENYRVAVVYNDKAYIAERKASLNGEIIDLKEFFKESKIISNTESITIFDHMKINSLKELDKETSKNFLKDLSLSEGKKLENKDYEEIAESQGKGESYYLEANLKDKTEYGFYIIPSMGILMAGDDKYTLPSDFLEKYKDVFSDLPKNIPPQV